MVGLSVMRKWIFHEFSVKGSKCLTANKFTNEAKIDIFLYPFIVLDNTFN